MSGNKALKYREFVQRLRRFGIVEMVKRGKGSERILLRPETPGSGKGPQIPIKHHGDNTEVGKGTVGAVLRRFDIDPKDFWGN